MRKSVRGSGPGCDCFRMKPLKVAAGKAKSVTYFKDSEGKGWGGVVGGRKEEMSERV